MKRNPKIIFLLEVAKHTGLHESDFKNIVEFYGRTLTSVVGEASNGNLFIAENGFLRQYDRKAGGRWNCKVLCKVSF